MGPQSRLRNAAALRDVDWDTTPVKDQGHCGSCWAFGSIGAIEGMNKVLTGSEVILSEQQLLDCDREGLDDGCNGGLVGDAYKYLSGKNLYTSASYPYTSGESQEVGQCKTGVSSGLVISGYYSVDKDHSPDSGLASALMNGPVGVTLMARGQFQNYQSGIMTGVPTACFLNHAVVATGYGPNFWKIKNSWGASWGEKGYARFERSTAGCGPFGLFFDDAYQPKLSQLGGSV